MQVHVLTGGFNSQLEDVSVQLANIWNCLDMGNCNHCPRSFEKIDFIYKKILFFESVIESWQYFLWEICWVSIAVCNNKNTPGNIPIIKLFYVYLC